MDSSHDADRMPVPGSEDERYRKDNSYNSSRNVRRCQEMTEQTTVNGQ